MCATVSKLWRKLATPRVPLSVGHPQLPARHEYILALHREVTARHLCLLAAVRRRRRGRVVKGAQQLLHPVQRLTLDPGLHRLVEDQVRPEAARKRELRELPPNGALLDVLEAVVRLWLVLVRVHHEDQRVVVVKPLCVTVLQAGVRRRQQGHHPVIRRAVGHLDLVVRCERRLAPQALVQRVCLLVVARALFRRAPVSALLGPSLLP